MTPCLTPQGRLALVPSTDAPMLETARAERIDRAFARGTGHGLLVLGATEVGNVLPPVFAVMRELRLMDALTTDRHFKIAGFHPLLLTR